MSVQARALIKTFLLSLITFLAVALLLGGER